MPSKRSMRRYTDPDHCQGFKPKWTLEKIAEFADTMVKDIAEDESIVYMRQYLSQKLVRAEHIYSFFPVSPYLENAYRMCQQIVSDRLQKACLHNTLNANHAGRFMPFFDPTVARSMREYKKELLEDQIETASKGGLSSEGVQVVLKIDERV